MIVPTWLQAIVLGVVQGLTEFIPVSSSGHLVLVPYLLSWERPGLAFDVALHLGTAGAVVVYFRQELGGMARALLRGERTREARLYRRLAVLLAVATVPIAVVGVLFTSFYEDLFEIPQVAASFLLATAVVLWVGERARTRRVETAEQASRAASAERRWTGDWVGEEDPAMVADQPLPDVGDDPEDPNGKDLERLGLREAVIVGLGQTLALFPGLSRSGTTITAGLLAGLTRVAATRFSFLLALPAMVGAALVSLPDLAEPGPYSGFDVLLGVLAGFVAGYLAIAFLLRLVARVGLTVFVRYLVAASAIGWFGYVILGPVSSV